MIERINHHARFQELLNEKRRGGEGGKKRFSKNRVSSSKSSITLPVCSTQNDERGGEEGKKRKVGGTTAWNLHDFVLLGFASLCLPPSI